MCVQEIDVKTRLKGIASDRQLLGAAVSRRVGYSPSRAQSAVSTTMICRHYKNVLRYLRTLCSDDVTAEELTQETFLNFFRQNKFVQLSDRATATYLRRTAYNLMVSHHRKFSRIQTVAEVNRLDESCNRWVGKDLVCEETIDVLEQCFQVLGRREKLALQMKFKEGASLSQIGKALGITDRGARNLIYRIKKELRKNVRERLKNM
jgi:RNA polymerase sigma-70 factor (ECF subfamily)